MVNGLQKHVDPSMGLSLEVIVTYNDKILYMTSVTVGHFVRIWDSEAVVKGTSDRRKQEERN